MAASSLDSAAAHSQVSPTKSKFFGGHGPMTKPSRGSIYTSVRTSEVCTLCVCVLSVWYTVYCLYIVLHYVLFLSLFTVLNQEGIYYLKKMYITSSFSLVELKSLRLKKKILFDLLTSGKLKWKNIFF